MFNYIYQIVKQKYPLLNPDDGLKDEVNPHYDDDQLFYYDHK